MTLSRLFRLAAMLLVPALLSNSFAFAAKKPADPAVMKAKIQARGVGQGVRVTLADKTEAIGLIVAIGDQSFTLKPGKSAEVRQIEFAHVTGVHRDQFTRGQEIGIGCGLIAAAVVLTVVIIASSFKGGFFTRGSGQLQSQSTETSRPSHRR
jgi:hypothetical protein